jgi:predicted nucleotidyltransferase
MRPTDGKNCPVLRIAWQVTEFALFGSVLQSFRPDSDIDVMVEFHPEAHPTFSTLDQMEAELKTISHRCRPDHSPRHCHQSQLPTP